MRAAVNRQYGSPSVVSVMEVPMPVARPGEVLVRVRAAAVTVADSRLRGARFPRGFALLARLGFGLLRPRRTVLGSSFSGEIAALAEGVARSETLSVGTAVCGMTGSRMGAHAEFISVPASRVIRKPDSMTHEDAAGLLFGATTALYFLRDRAALGPGQTVLVNGASGAVGTNAVQLAKHFGARVTAVTSAPNLALAQQLGAENTIDYIAAPLSGLTSRFDVVFDTVGTVSPALAKTLLQPGGVALLAAADLWEILGSRGQVKTGVASERTEDIEFLLELAAAGGLVTVLDEVRDLTEIRALYDRVDSGRKVGNVVVRL